MKVECTYKMYVPAAPTMFPSMKPALTLYPTFRPSTAKPTTKGETSKPTTSNLVAFSVKQVNFTVHLLWFLRLILTGFCFVPFCST